MNLLSQVAKDVKNARVSCGAGGMQKPMFYITLRAFARAKAQLK